MPNMVEVAPVPPVPLHDLLTYHVPEGMRGSVQPGVRVRVPLGRQVRTGIVTARAEIAPERGLRSLLEILDPLPLLPPDLLDLCRWAARYYLVPLAEVIATIVPAGLPAPYREHVVRLVRRLDPDEETALARRAPVRSRAYHALLLAGGELRRDDARAAGLAPATLRGLVAAGLAAALTREPSAAPEATPTPVPGPTLTEGQQQAVQAICGSLDGTRASFLLHGITGSGKTEVFLAAAEHALGAGRSVLLLVPEIALTHQLVDRVRTRLGRDVALLHSGVGPRERWGEWRRIRSGAARIVIGARSAVFAPIVRLGLVVVDEEHDGAYKQEEGLRYNARDLAVVRARQAGAVTVLASATPSAETFLATQDGRHTLLTLPERPTRNPLPPVTTVDLRGRRRVGRSSALLTDELRSALEANLARGGQALVFLNRRGFATYLQCAACGEAVTCPHCSVTLTWHRAARALVCHHCRHARQPPARCPACRAEALAPFGIGTEQIEAALADCYPLATVGRLDRDAARRVGAQRRILDAWRAGETDILVGTQMVSKGHDVAGVTFVAVLLADLSLNVPDFRAAERTFQLLVQVAGRAGRGDVPGAVHVQTFRPEHPSIAAAASHDYAGFIAGELERRRALGYPPFARLVNVRLEGRDGDAVETAARELGTHLRARARDLGLGPECVLGPAPPPIERLRGRERRQILLRSADVRALRAVARAVREREPAIRRTGTRLVIDVDPYSMM